MNDEIQSIVSELKNSLEGTPWFGRPVIAIIEEVNADKVYERPNAASHSLIDLLYHMNTWADFTLKRIEKNMEMDLVAFEKLDWRKIEPSVHHWDDAVAEFKAIHEKIITTLQSKQDDFLDERVDFRKYNFRYLLNGLVQHNIYHTGQMAYLQKLLE